MKKIITDAIKKEFLDIYNEIKDLTDNAILNGPDTTTQSCFQKLQDLISRDVNDHLADNILCDREFQTIIKRLSHLKRINGLGMEIEAAKTIIASPDPWALIETFPYYPNYLELARMEFHGADLNQGDLVVFLGSGPLPMSLICLCRQHEVQGIGIEQSAEYAELSQRVVKRLGLTEYVKILNGNHFTLPIKEECQLIMVGADASPKDEIFVHLAKELPVGAKLSFRIYEKGLRRLMDDLPVSHLPSQFKEYTRIRPEPPVNNTSVFISKVSH